MNIVAICIVGVFTSVIALSIKRYNSEISFLLAIAGCMLIFLSILLNLNSVKEIINSVLAVADINISYITILIKAMGICFLTEFASDCCMDAGQKALANNVSLAGKIFVLITAVPLYKEVLDTVISLTGGTV